MKIIEVCAIDFTMNNLLRELNNSIKKEGHDLICVYSKGKYSKIILKKKGGKSY